MGSVAEGLYLIALTGLLWALVGAVFSHASRQNVELIAFLFVSSLFNAIGAWIFLFKPAYLDRAGSGACLPMVGVMILAALFGSLGFQLMGNAMRKGNRGVIWTVSQSAMILPLFTALLFFNEKLGVLNGLGIVLILAGMVMLGIKKSAVEEPANSDRGWLWMSYAVFILVGISLSLTTLPSHWKGFRDDASLRLPVIFTATMLYFLPQIIAKGKRSLTPRTFALGLTYSVVTFLGQYCLYRSLDGFEKFGRVGMVYPAAIGICVVLFYIYSVVFLKEEFKGRTIASVSGITAGIFLLAR
jgi:uncharacterized membrane protein